MTFFGEKSYTLTELETNYKLGFAVTFLQPESKVLLKGMLCGRTKLPSRMLRLNDFLGEFN